jgi:hypothetical protein
VTGEVIPIGSRRAVPLHMMTAEQEAEALAAIRAARLERDETIDGAYITFNDLIRAYEAAGLRVTDIADAAMLTRSRIYQIIELWKEVSDEVEPPLGHHHRRYRDHLRGLGRRCGRRSHHPRLGP